MRDRVKLGLAYDAVRMRTEVERLEREGWIDHFVTQNYQGSWQVLPLRGPVGATHPVMMIYADPSCESFEDTPFLDQCPYFREVLQTFACPLESVRLMKLAAGSQINEHRDHDLCLENGVVRMHVPVYTNTEVEFKLNGERVDMHPGECWYLRLSDPHEVANRGTTDRVHLVIDARVNDWLRNQIEGTESDAP